MTFFQDEVGAHQNAHHLVLLQKAFAYCIKAGRGCVSPYPQVQGKISDLTELSKGGLAF
jgi:hypothetical protein